MNNDLIERIARAIQEARDEIGATAEQRIAFAYAEAAMRSAMQGEVGGLREATDEMIDAGIGALDDTSPDTSEAFVAMIYRAMIAAAPHQQGSQRRSRKG